MDSQLGVLRSQAALGSQLVGSSMEVKHFAIVGKCLEPVGKALRNNESFVINGP